MSFDFSPLSGVTLKRGSHKLPSEGSCTMEVAALVAGYGWREVESADDLPECMCRVLGAYVIQLQDAMPDDERQRLLAYVTRFGGTRGDAAVSMARAEHLVMHAARPAAAAALRRADLADHADAVAGAETPAALRAALRAAKSRCAPSVLAVRAVCAALWATVAVQAEEAEAAAEAEAVQAAVLATMAMAAASPLDWTPYLAALDGALAIGPQAPEADVEHVRRVAALINPS